MVWWTFLIFFVAFHCKTCVFIIFISFLKKYQISSTEHLQIKNKNWSSKMSMELYAMFPRYKSLNQQLKYVAWNRCYWTIDKIFEMYSRRRSSSIEALKTATLLQTNLILILILKDPDHILIRSWSQTILIRFLVISHNFGVL